MLRAFCDAVEQRNGKAFAELFTEDGVYHDVFYGAFEGRAKIAEHDRRLVLSHGHRFPLGHARPRQRRPDALCALHLQLPLDAAGGRRARGRCSRASRSCGCATARSRSITRSPTPRRRSSTSSFAPERIAKIVAKQGAALKARPEMKRHLGVTILPSFARRAKQSTAPQGRHGSGSSLRCLGNDG